MEHSPIGSFATELVSGVVQIQRNPDEFSKLPDCMEDDLFGDDNNPLGNVIRRLAQAITQQNN